MNNSRFCAACRTESPLDAALHYAAQGLPVYPVYAPDNTGGCTCSKGAACEHPGKHPSTQHGVHDATTDPERIRASWGANPDRNVGIATGNGRGLLDVDKHSDRDGFQSLKQLEPKLGPLPPTVTCETPTHGRHFYVRVPAGFTFKNWVGKLGAGLDIRADGGGVVAPPSSHVKGGRYAWVYQKSPCEIELSELPPAWAEYIAACDKNDSKHPERSLGTGPGRSDDQQVDVIVQGQRNSTLASLAGTMRGRGMSEESILAALVAENATRCDPPLADDEVISIAGSIAKYRPRKHAVDDRSVAVVPPFPVDVFSEPVRSFIALGARALSVPPDLIAVPLFAIAGAVMGDCRSIALKQGYVQRPILFTAVVAPPGSAKSPALDRARSPLDRMQGAAAERFQAANDQYKADLAAWQSGGPGQRGPRPEPPQFEHFFTTDATMEALMELLSRSHGIVLVNDEIVTWVKSCDAYRGGKGADRQHWLSAWSGSPIKVDRKGREPIFIPTPHICVTGGVQPDLLGDLADAAGKQDGFIERILWSYPEVRAGVWSEETVPEQIEEEMLELFERLRASEQVTYRLDAEAKAAWSAWHNENNRITQLSSGYLAGVHAKLPNQVARLALILQSLRDPLLLSSPTITVETLRDALRLGDYFLAHTARVLATIPPSRHGPTARLQDRVLAVLKIQGGWLPKRELYDQLGGHTPAEALETALQSLEADGLVEQQVSATGGPGRPSVLWRYKENSEQYE